MKALYSYLKESIFDVDDHIDNFDNTVLNDVIGCPLWWRVGKDNKTIVFDSSKYYGTASINIENDKIDIKNIIDLKLKFQPIRDLGVSTDDNCWNKFPCDCITNYRIGVKGNTDVDLSKLKMDIEASIQVFCHRADKALHINLKPYSKHVPVVLLRGVDHVSYPIESVYGWDCDILYIMCENIYTGSNTWTNFHGFNEESVGKILANNPKAKTIYLVAREHENIAYKIKKKGSGKNAKIDGVNPISIETVQKNINNKGKGTFQYMAFRHNHKELF